GILGANKNSQTYFFELMNMKSEERKRLHPFIGQLTAQIGQRPRFALDRSSLAKVQAESNRLAQVLKSLPKDHRARGWMKDSMSQLNAVKENLVGRIN